MTGVPQAYATQAPSTNDFSQSARVVGVSFARAERKFVNGIHSDIVANVEDAGAFVALKAVHVFRSVGFAAADRAIVDGMRPGIARLEGDTASKPALKR